MLLFVVALALVGTACGSNIEQGSPDAGGGTNTPTEPPSQAPDAKLVREQPADCKVEASADLAKKPEIKIPDCTPSTDLIAVDLVPGTGAEFKAGQEATIHYVGISWSNKEQFDASWDRNEPFSTTIPGQLIDGWNEGIPGMKVGGRRLLIIPPSKGYGPSGQGPIGPNETLVFVVDLKAAK
ncbi:MAG TPA: FKBP-type peptidyl-prolyl cis-trans isomerase [Actinomycetota bacterium]|nr:FKBP-type peptidyl-prolyl cis-trans isomerase [Actinomycetota bacterium]